MRAQRLQLRAEQERAVRPSRSRAASRPAGRARSTACARAGPRARSRTSPTGARRWPPAPSARRPRASPRCRRCRETSRPGPASSRAQVLVVVDLAVERRRRSARRATASAGGRRATDRGSRGGGSRARCRPAHRPRCRDRRGRGGAMASVIRPAASCRPAAGSVESGCQKPARPHIARNESRAREAARNPTAHQNGAAGLKAMRSSPAALHHRA